MKVDKVVNLNEYKNSNKIEQGALGIDISKYRLFEPEILRYGTEEWKEYHKELLEELETFIDELEDIDVNSDEEFQKLCKIQDNIIGTFVMLQDGIEEGYKEY